MRRLILVLAFGLVVGVIAGNFAVHVASLPDARYRIAGWERPPSLMDRLADPDRGPVLFVPNSLATLDERVPAELVLALPGLGGIGMPMAEALASAAESHQWLVVAPTPMYERPDGGESFAVADVRVDNDLLRILDSVRTTMHRPIASRIFVMGFSRGAQSAHRFALRHPDLVAAVASLSAGSYTMPTSDVDYPFGVGHFSTWNYGRDFDAVALRGVSFFVGVGDKDVDLSGVPAEWDAVEGKTRVERARHFADALGSLAVPVHPETFAGAAHELTADMLARAVAWFASRP